MIHLVTLSGGKVGGSIEEDLPLMKVIDGP